MAWLESFLAFALTMLVFSTVITIIIEGIHRFLAMREKGMELMLDALFEKVIWPQFGRHFAGKTKDEVRGSFTRLLGNQGMNEEKLGALTKALVPAKLTKLTSMQFAERLAQTEIGTKIATEIRDALQKAGQNADAAIDQIVKDLVQKFERFGAEASEFFKRRSQAFAVAIGFVLAFAVNFDAVRVFQSYLRDDNLRQSLIASSDAIQKQYQDAAEKLQKAAAEDEKAKAATVDALNREFKDRQAAVEKALADLRTRGVPIGWSYFPFCDAGGSAAPNLPQAGDARCERRETGDYVYWFLAVLLAGALVGLGGPFWYDTVRSLSAVLQFLRPPSPAPKAEPGVAFLRADGQADTRQPENPVEAFRTAAEARKSMEKVTPAAGHKEKAEETPPKDPKTTGDPPR